jgi:hypothetical protein
LAKCTGIQIRKNASQNLQVYLPLPYAFNVKSSVQLIDELINNPFDPKLQFVSFDITNMYSNDPTDDLINIIESLRENHGIIDKLKYELIKHFQHHNKTKLLQIFLNIFYLQEKGLAMGSPTFSIFSEIYLQYIENTAIYDILRYNNIAGYFQYVDDILIVYNNTTTNIIDVFNSFNEVMPTMKFRIVVEVDNKIKFLDITILKKHDKLAFNIYRKPTTTDPIFPNDSRHPQEHKLAAIRYLTKRMNTYSLNAANKEKESNKIKHILHKNKYDLIIIIIIMFVIQFCYS